MNQSFLLTAISIATLPYVLLPILLRKTHKLPLKPQIRPRLMGFIPKNIQNHLDNLTKTLHKDKFLYCADGMSNDLSPLVSVFLRIYKCVETNALLTFSVAIPSDNSQKILKSFIEVTNFFTDGNVYVTRNKDIGNIPLQSAKKRTTVLTNVDNIEKLLKIHNIYKRKFFNEQKQLDISSDDVLVLIESHIREDLKLQKEMGAFKIDSNKYYHLTWAGAFLMTWYSMWPFTFIRKCLLSIKSRILLYRIG